MDTPNEGSWEQPGSCSAGGDGAAGGRHTGAVASAGARGEQNLGNASALSSLCDALSTYQPGRGAHVPGIWAEEVKLLQSTDFIAKYVPVRRVLVVRAELRQC